MMNLGITGMTVSHVLGCGVQKGKPEYYRGVQIEANLLPKIQVEIVVSKVPVRVLSKRLRKCFIQDISETVRFSFRMWKML